MHRPTLLLAGLGLALVVTAPARAQDDLPERRVRYLISGHDQVRGAFDGWLVVEPREGAAWEVVRLARFAGGDEDLRRGSGAPEGDRLQVRLDRDRGAADVVAGAAAARPVFLTLVFDDDGERASLTEVFPEGARRGQAQLEPGTSADDGEDDPLLDRAKGHLLALARETVEDAAHDGVSLDQRFRLTDYLHLGVGAGVEVVAPEEQSFPQKATLQARPQHAWLTSTIEGGARVPLNASIPVGEVTVGVGIEPGARITYRVTDLYALPGGWGDAGTLARSLARLGKRAFQLPLEADDARALTPGAERVFEGQASVAVRGSLSIGHEVANVGDVARIGASGRVSGFYRIQGDVRIHVRRLLDDHVRVRLTRGKTRSRGAAADVLLGATVAASALQEEIDPLVEYIDVGRFRPVVSAGLAVAGAEVAQRVLRIQVAVGRDRVLRDELDLAYTFDLTRPKARAAYERAVRGDLTRAGDLARDPVSGVEEAHRVVEVEERTHLGADLDLSVLLDAGAHRRVTLEDLDVEDASGRTRFEVFRFRRERHFDPGFLDRERRRTLTVEAVRETPAGDGAPTFTRGLRFELDVEDPSTFKGEADEFRRVLRFVGLDAQNERDEPGFRLFRSRYGETRTRFAVSIGEAGLQRILAASEERLLDAYVRAFAAASGKRPTWATAAGRNHLRNEHRFPTDDRRDPQLEREYQEMLRAERFVKGMRTMAGAGTAEARSEAMEEVAKNARYDLYEAAALVSLAPRDAVSIEASLTGERIRVFDAHHGERARLVAVRDPRR